MLTNIDKNIDKIYNNIIKEYKIFLVKFLKFLLENNEFDLYKKSINLVIPILFLIEDNVQLKTLLFCIFIDFKNKNTIVQYLFLIGGENHNFTVSQFEELKIILENYNKKYIDFLYIEKDSNFRSKKFHNLLKKVNRFVLLSFLEDLFKTFNFWDEKRRKSFIIN